MPPYMHADLSTGREEGLGLQPRRRPTALSNNLVTEFHSATLKPDGVVLEGQTGNQN